MAADPSMEGHANLRILSALAAKTSSEAGHGSAAAGVVALCADIGTALAPIVGPRGVAALYKRSLFLTSHDHPQLLGLHEAIDASMDLAPLEARLATLNDAQATQVGGALLLSFHQLLDSLVGTSLTERLLRSLWGRPLSDPPASEPTP